MSLLLPNLRNIFDLYKQDFLKLHFWFFFLVVSGNTIYFAPLVNSVSIDHIFYPAREEWGRVLYIFDQILLLLFSVNIAISLTAYMV